jgi:hypothetical protein
MRNIGANVVLTDRAGRREQRVGGSALRGYFRHPAIIGVLGGATLTVAGVLTPPNFRDDLIVGLISVLIGLVLELRIRGEQTERRKDVVSRLLEGLDVLPPELAAAAQRRLLAYATAANTARRVPLYSQVLADRMDELQTWLDEVGSGRISVSREHASLLTSGMRQAGEVLGVTGGSESLKWWHSAAGQEYLAANLTALARGARVRRIFVEEASLSKSDKRRLHKLIKQNVDAGVDCYYVEASNLLARRLDFSDTTIFDSTLLHRAILVGREQRLDVVYSINEDDIRRARDQFELILGLARPVRPGAIHMLIDDSLDIPAETPDLTADFESDDAAASAELLRLIFRKAMPPAFVKAVTPTDEIHILENEPFEEFQHASLNRGLASEVAAGSVIRSDHQTGDLGALRDGVFRQIEIAEARSGERNRAILTTKTLVRFRSHQYIVGWYVPVECDLPDKREFVTLTEDRHQVVLGLSVAPPGMGITVRVGAAARQ